MSGCSRPSTSEPRLGRVWFTRGLELSQGKLGRFLVALRRGHRFVTMGLDAPLANGRSGVVSAHSRDAAVPPTPRGVAKCRAQTQIDGGDLTSEELSWSRCT